MTLAEAMKRIADLEGRVAFMQREFDQTLAALVLAGEYAGRTLVTPPAPEPMGQLLAFPAGRRGTHKRVAGSAVTAQVTRIAAPRRASTTGRAS